MSAFDRILTSIRRIILMESRIQTLADSVDKIAETMIDHEKRLVRLETMVEISRALPPAKG
jgi:hypothetical protein